MHDRLFEAALGITPPWFVAGVSFDEPSRVLTVGIDFTAGGRFAVQGVAAEHPVHDTVTKTCRHLSFFQHAALQRWCTCVMRSKVAPMKEVVALVRRHLGGIVAWAQT